ncbi:hypothetical protein ACSBR1_026160 [Camellia fascicularis]
MKKSCIISPFMYFVFLSYKLVLLMPFYLPSMLFTFVSSYFLNNSVKNIFKPVVLFLIFFVYLCAFVHVVSISLKDARRHII